MDHPHVHGLHRGAVSCPEISCVTITQYRIRSTDRVREIDDVTHPHILENEQGRDRAVVNAALELVFPLENVDFGVFQSVLFLVVARWCYVVDRQGLGCWLEAYLDWR